MGRVRPSESPLPTRAKVCVNLMSRTRRRKSSVAGRWLAVVGSRRTPLRSKTLERRLAHSVASPTILAPEPWTMSPQNAPGDPQLAVFQVVECAGCEGRSPLSTRFDPELQQPQDTLRHAQLPS